MTMIDFFEQQRRTRKRAYALVACLFGVVAVIITVIYLALVLIDVPGRERISHLPDGTPMWVPLYSTLGITVLVIASGIICFQKLLDGKSSFALGGSPRSTVGPTSSAPDSLRQAADTAAVVCLAIVVAGIAILFRFFVIGSEELQPIQWFQPRLLAGTACMTLAVLLAGSVYKTLELRRGERLAAMLGGQPINSATTNRAEQRIRNVVEEMAIAAGLPVPRIFLLKDECGINALAAGLTREDAIICISQGALDYLNRDELQAVVAHEFSHILNGDMRFNLRLVGILHGILFIGLAGKFLTFAAAGVSRESAEDGHRLFGVIWSAPILLLGLALYVIGSAGLLVGRAIRAAVSRQREYLADASAVEFTRNPQGVSNALKKIGGVMTHSYLRTRHAESASHMFFERIHPHGHRGWFATHPPLVDRIRAIDKQFDGRFPQVTLLPHDQVRIKNRAAMALNARLPVSRDGGEYTPSLDVVAANPAQIIATIGVPSMDDLQYASQWLANLPEELEADVHDPFSARCIVFALLLDRRPETRESQLLMLHDREGAATRHETERIATQLRAYDRACRLPLLVLAQSALRQLSPEQYEQFHKIVTRLMRADEQISLFEFVVSCVVLVHLDRAFGRRKPPQVRYYGLRGLASELAILLSALARLGNRTAPAAELALQRSVPALQLHDRVIALLEARQCTLAHVQSALEKLLTCSLPVKKRVLSAATLCVAADGQVSAAEAEMLRAIAISLDCPLPLVIPGAVQPSAR